MVHITLSETNRIRHEYWEDEQYNRQPNAIGRHPCYVCYEYPKRKVLENREMKLLINIPKDLLHRDGCFL